MAKGIQYINKKRQNRALFKIRSGAYGHGCRHRHLAEARPLRSVSHSRERQLPQIQVQGSSVGSSSGGETRRQPERTPARARNLFGFDANKSSDKKFAMYNGYVDKLYAMVLKANDMPETRQRDKVKAAIAATTSTPSSGVWV